MNSDYLWIRRSISLQLVFIVESKYTCELLSLGILPKSPDIRRSFGHFFFKETLYFSVDYTKNHIVHDFRKL